MNAPDVSVVVPTRDRPDALARCLAAIEAQSGPSFEVVVVDDGSRDEAAVAAVVDDAPHARRVRASGRGPASARNRGAELARAPLLCFTDDDCRPAPGWLAALHTRFEAGATAIAGPTVAGNPDAPFDAAAQTVTNHLVEWSRDPRYETVAFAPTSNLACSAELHAAVPFDESFPLAAGEDRDWCRRVAEHGAAIVYDEHAVVEHFPDLTLADFWRQQERYGQGAYEVQRRLPAGESRLQPLAFYRDLVRKGFASDARVGGLVLLAQVATATGLARAYLSAGARR